MRVILAGLTGGIVLASSFGRMSSKNDDRVIVAALDTRYQVAVRSHDAATMSAILADDFVLVTGRGQVYSRAELHSDAYRADLIYDRQADGKSVMYGREG